MDRDELSRMGKEVVKSTNCQNLPIRRGFYVRVRPPDRSECEDVKKDVRWLKFTRVGVQVEVLEDFVRGGWVEVRCGKDQMAWDEREFRRTFVRIVDGLEFLENERRAS